MGCKQLALHEACLSPLIRLTTGIAAILHQFCICGCPEVGAKSYVVHQLKSPRDAFEIQYRRSVTIQTCLRGVPNFSSFEVTFFDSGHSSST